MITDTLFGLRLRVTLIISDEVQSNINCSKS